MKYRSRTEIVSLILEAANGGGATKTRIMYKAFLSFAQLREYLTMLQESGLIEYEGGKQTYRTTEKGMSLLQIYEKIYELAPPVASTPLASTAIAATATAETSFLGQHGVVNTLGGRY